MLKDKLKKRRYDFLLLTAIIAAGVVFALFLLVFSKQGGAVRVSVNGEKIAEYPLDTDAVYTIQGCGGGTNTLTISGGYAFVSESSCPDHLCEKTGKINKAGQSVICLPNRVIVEIIGTPSSDAVLG